MKLDITNINLLELIDHPTLAVYMDNGADKIVEANRPYYPESKEICVRGIYFAITKFNEGDTEFTVCSQYKKTPRAKKTYRYAFGAYDPDKNDLVWFFDGLPVATTRQAAVKTYVVLKRWCESNAPKLQPFAYKK
jgi:hypothetical protein